MSEIADRYRKVPDQFVRRVHAVPDGGWDQPAPCAAWDTVDRTIRAALDDPAVAGAERETSVGPATFERSLDTWDLARATGLDEQLDPDEVHRLFVGSEPYDDHDGPGVEVPGDADEQTGLIVFIGRRP